MLAGNIEEHQVLEDEISKLIRMAEELSVNSGISEGIKFNYAISAFHSNYLIHIQHEEGEVLDLLWENFTDEELLILNAQIVKSFTPAQVINSYKYIIPALNPEEQFRLLAGLKANAPQPFFLQIMEMLRSLLQSKYINRLEEQLCTNENAIK
jgi:hypothetical protein